jgi:N4-gp56 family major capsid protein
MAVNTLAALTNEQKTFYERVLLERLKPNLVFYNYGEKKTIPKNEGLTINFRRFDAHMHRLNPVKVQARQMFIVQ